MIMTGSINKDLPNMPPTFGSVSSSSNNNNTSTTKKNNSVFSNDADVPNNLTVNGTTPSGKPRLFVCTICTRAFARQEHLKRHERSHTKEKPFACSVCSRKFSRRDLLLRHCTKLHAGCADMVPRMRRKSTKSSISSNTNTSNTFGGQTVSTIQSSIDSPRNSISKKINPRIRKISRTPSISSAANALIEKDLNKKRNKKLSKDVKASTSDDNDDDDDDNENENENENDFDDDDDESEDFEDNINNNNNKDNITSGLNKNYKLPSSNDHNENIKLKPVFDDYNEDEVFGNLQNQFSKNISPRERIFDEKAIHHLSRRASFSAMSGVNYAMPTAEPYATETVEFATPQMVGLDDSENWLNNLGPIPSLDFMNPDFSRSTDNNNNNNNNNNNINNNTTNFPGGKDIPINYSSNQSNPLIRNFVHEELAPDDPISKNQDITGYSFYDVPSRNVESLFTHSNINFKNNKDSNNNNNNNTFNNNGTHFRYIQLQDSPETDSSNGSMLSPDQSQNPLQSSVPGQTYNQSLSDRINKTLMKNIDELEEITDLNGSKNYKISQGYSFYGNIDHQTIPNSSSCSSNATISPILLDNSVSNPGSGLPGTRQNSPLNSSRMNSLNPPSLPQSQPQSQSQSQNQLQSNFENISNPVYNIADKNSILHVDSSNNNINNKTQLMNSIFNDNLTNNNPTNNISNNNTNNAHQVSHDRFEKYSRVNLFTPTIRHYIYQSLTKYPFIGVPNPTVPDNDKLNYYTQQFKEKFLNHHPFIHSSILNEYSLIKMIMSTISIHPLVSNDENTIDNTRVSLVCLPLLIATIGAVVSNKKNDASNLYEASRRCIHVYLDSRKKNALNIATKMSNGGGVGIDISNYNDNSSPLWLVQSLTLSVVYGLFADNEISLNVIIRQVNALNSLIKSSGLNVLNWKYDPDRDTIDQIYFDDFIKYESTIRSIHMVFHISSLLSSLYNIVPSLKSDDLFINLPVSSILWDCKKVSEFQNCSKNFGFNSFNFHQVLNELLDLNYDTENDNKTTVANLFLERHVSEFGLICLQNGLHQLNYFQQLTEINNLTGFNLNPEDTKLNKIKLINIVSKWDSLLKNCRLYDNSSPELICDCKIMNSFLSLKLSPLINLNKIKENVWLKSWTDVCEIYYSSFNFSELDFENEEFNIELLKIVDKSIDIFKVIFFKPISDNVNNINEQLGEITDPELGQLDFEGFQDKISINIQVLFDVFLNLIKFLTNYERVFKDKIQLGHSNVSFVQHFELQSTIFNNNSKLKTTMSKDEEYMEQYKERCFKNYQKIFKIYLNLEAFLKINYGYHDFESEFSSLSISNIVNNRKSNENPDSSLLNDHLNFHHQSTDPDQMDDITDPESIQNTTSNESEKQFTRQRDRDLIINELISYKLPFKLLKIGEFLFSFIYDKNLKFVIFQNLSNALFHLRIFMENREEYMD